MEQHPEAPPPSGPALTSDNKVAVIKSPGWNELDKGKFFFYGPIFSFGVRLLLYPPSLIKTRLQVQDAKAPEYKNGRQALVQIVRKEGMRGLYSGFWPSLFGIGIGQVYLTTYEVTRQNILERNEERGLMSRESVEVWRNMAAGTLASLIANSMGVPLDIVVQRMMLEKADGSNQIVRALSMGREIARAEGLRGLYRGYWVQVAQFAPGSGIWWAAYSHMSGRLGEVSERNGLDRWISPTPLTILVQAGASMCASVLSVVVTNPIDVLRTRLQTDERQGTTLRQVARELWRNEGAQALGAGMGARMVASIPSSIFMITYYEHVKRLSVKPAEED